MRTVSMLAWGLTLSLAAALPEVAGWADGPAGVDTAALAASVEQAVRDAMATDHLPGAAVLVGRGDRVLYRGAIGWRALMPGLEALTPETVFDLGSLTKVVATAPLVLALSEDGALDLDAPVGRYLAEFRLSAWRDVTLRRLLLHAGGVPASPGPPARASTMAALLGDLARRGPERSPGAGFQYSDAGFLMLGEVVQRVAGAPLDEIARRRLFEPLGMRATAFRPPLAWRGQIAPTEMVHGRLLRGEVHDPHARALGGVAGHAGVFSTVDDLARFCRMLLAEGELDGRRVLRKETVHLMLEAHPVGEVTRALGWDVASPYSGTLGPFFPPRSVGHTGFPGTALWLDPSSGTYLVLLTNRIHPDGRGQVADVRRRVSGAVGALLFGRVPPLAQDASTASPAGSLAVAPELRVRTGIDRLVADGFRPLDGRAVGLLTNQTGIDREGRRTVDDLAAGSGVHLRALFSPEHGPDGAMDRPVPHGRDLRTAVPVWSLYGPTRRPTHEMLAGLDTVAVDLQDVGVRYYTYLTTLVYVLEEAARYRVPVVVLDRPNPITGRLIEGPIMDADLRSFTAPHPVPVRTGLTIGEFARMVVAERGLAVSLTVIPVEGWHRSEWFDETGLCWVDPSPNIRSVNEALLYAGIGLLEATNLSVGRGTDTPFELVGAPWIADPATLAGALNALRLPGVGFEPVSFTPTAEPYAGVMVHGFRIVVRDREAVRPVRLGLALARVLSERYREYRPAAIQDLLVHRDTIWAFLRGDPLADVWRWLDADEARFEARRQPYLLYR